MLEWVLLMGWWILQHPTVATDERPDVGHDEDIHPNTLMESTRDVLDFGDSNLEEGRNWNPDWPPLSPPQENDPSLSPEALTRGLPAIENNNETTDLHMSPHARCGEYSSRLIANRQCQLVATLPPVLVGASQKRCPDMFRCTDDISQWLQENQERKEQLGELSETMSELQEELRNHQHRVKALDTQVCPLEPQTVVTVGSTRGHSIDPIEEKKNSHTLSPSLPLFLSVCLHQSCLDTC